MTVSEFFEFLAQRKGLMDSERLRLWTTASRRLLEDVDPMTPIENLDIDAIIAAWLRSHPVSNDTMMAYRSRLRAALSEAMASRVGSSVPGQTDLFGGSARSVKLRSHRQTTTSEGFNIQVPLGPGRVITVQDIPWDLTLEEAERVHAVLVALTDRKNAE